MASLEELLSVADTLPSPPGVAMAIIRVNEDEDVRIAELAEIVSRDPAIAAKLLRMANSSALGRPGQVGDIGDAIMLLGIRSVNLIALSFSLAASSTGTGCRGFDYTRYWTLAAATTIAARLIAEKKARPLRDESFLAGLLCDFCQVLLAESAGHRYEAVVAAAKESGRPIEEVEAEMLESDHARLGGELFRHWGLPEVIADAIEGHHDPSRIADEGSPAGQLARILRMANVCAALYVDADPSDADLLMALARDDFEATADEVQELLDDMRAQVPEFLEVLDLESVDAAEIARLRDQANQMLVRESLELEQRLQSAFGAIDVLSQRNSELKERATIDPLTGLRNRGSFEEALEFEFERKLDEGGSVGLLMIDVDRFKLVNDRHGHLAGDLVLREVARAMEARLASNETVFRCGGDEFQLLALDVSAEDLLVRGQLLRKAVERIVVQWENESIRPTLSIGGCVAEGHALGDRDPLIAAADAELYRAKKKGRNRVFVTSLDKATEPES